MAQDFYQVLRVPKHASAAKIRDAYRALARKYHPDVNRADDAQDKFTEIQAAYDVLGDESKRRVYDQLGHAAFSAQAAHATGGGGYSRGPQPGGGFGFEDEDLGSVFDAFFNSGGARQPGGSPFGGAKRKPSTARDLEITFMTAVRGGVEPVRLNLEGSEQRVEVAVPAGVQEGARLRAQIPGGSEVIFTVRIGRHPIFRRVPGRPLDLEFDLPLSFAEAALGAKVAVPTPGGPITLTIPPGASSGRRLRARGHGIAPAKADPGDLLARITIASPDPAKLTDEERLALREIASKSPRPRSGPDWPTPQQATGTETGDTPPPPAG